MNVLALAGFKGSGKNTVANFIAGMTCLNAKVFSEFHLNENGRLVVPSTKGDGVLDFDLHHLNFEFKKWLAENVWPYVKLYSFADKLKQFCIEHFNLTPQQCYGTEQDKNSSTEVLWENLPHYKELKNKPKGLMTAREVLQQFGTNVCRRMMNDCWANALIKEIKREQSWLSIITDMRFENEAKKVEEIGGNCVLLTRKTGEDNHESENGLKNYQFKYIIDNQNISRDQTMEKVVDLLAELKIATIQTEREMNEEG